MGIRTYIYGVDTPKIDEVNLENHHEPDNYVCLGKMVAYVSPDGEKLETVKLLEEILKDPEDIDYIKQYKEHGYCGEYITFNRYLHMMKF